MKRESDIVGRQIKNGKYRTGRGDDTVYVTEREQPCLVTAVRYPKFDGWCVTVSGCDRSIQIDEKDFLPQKRSQKIVSWTTWRTHNFKASRSFSHAGASGERYFHMTDRHSILTQAGFRRLDLPEFGNECHVLGEKGKPLTPKQAARRWLDQNHDPDEFAEIVFWTTGESIYITIYGRRN